MVISWMSLRPVFNFQTVFPVLSFLELFEMQARLGGNFPAIYLTLQLIWINAFMLGWGCKGEQMSKMGILNTYFIPLFFFNGPPICYGQEEGSFNSITPSIYFDRLGALGLQGWRVVLGRRPIFTDVYHSCFCWGSRNRLGLNCCEGLCKTCAWDLNQLFCFSEFCKFGFFMLLLISW